MSQELFAEFLLAKRPPETSASDNDDNDNGDGDGDGDGDADGDADGDGDGKEATNNISICKYHQCAD